MAKYTYEARYAGGGEYMVLARGPRGGTRWIANYRFKGLADHVARVLNQAESANSRREAV